MYGVIDYKHEIGIYWYESIEEWLYKAMIR